MREVVLVSAARTAIGSFGGALASLPAPRLGAVAVQAAVERAGLSPDQVQEVILGNVLSAGVGQAPARQAAIFAGLPKDVGCLTVNKVCGSGLKAVMLAAQAIGHGDADVVVAGGMESMSNTPYLLDKARNGYRMGHGQLLDSMIKDGLWDVYNDYHMGSAAELCASECGIGREAQDTFAAESYRRAMAAAAAGKFQGEIVPVTITQGKEQQLVTVDEEPAKGRIDRFPTLKPVFKKDGTVTAANASSLNDGAAALVVMSADRAKALGCKPLARIVAQGGHAQAPEWFTTAPAYAIQKVLQRAGIRHEDVDAFEVNEAFSVVSLAVQQKVGYDPEKVNCWGGAVALGHPIGASGARVLVTLLSVLRDRGGRYGLASLCIGGGEAVALVVENLA